MLEIKGKLNEILTKLDKELKTLDYNKIFVLTIKQWRKKRTLDQNALYWKLLNDFAKWGEEDINVLHNQMLSSYGVATDEYSIVPEDKKIEKLSDRHYKRTSKKVKGKDGVIYQYCRVMKGSHELNTHEMKRLIEGLINEIKGSAADADIKIDYEELENE